MPTNTSAGAAEVITGLPASYTVDLEDQPVDLWYSFTAPTNQVAISVRATVDPDNGLYRPVIRFYEPDGVTLYLGLAWEGTHGHTCLAPMEDGATVLINLYRVVTSTVGAGVIVDIDTPPLVDAPSGSFLIPADARLPGDSHFGTILSATTGEPLQVRAGLPAGETGDTLIAFGLYLMTDYAAGGLRLMGGQLATVTTITGLFDTHDGMQFLIVHASATKFFAAQNVASSAADATVWRFSTTGVLETSWTLPSNSHNMRCFGVSPDGETAYYGVQSGTTLHRYDLAGSAPLTDFPLTAMSGRRMADYGVNVLGDGTVVVHQHTDGSVGVLSRMYWYQADGTVIQFFNAPTGYQFDRAQRAFDDPFSFWIWMKTVADTSPSARYLLMETATGVEVLHLDQDEYIESAKDADLFATDGPKSRATGVLTNHFGALTSCPLIVLRELIPAIPTEEPEPEPEPGALGTRERRQIRRERVSPHFIADGVRQFFHTLQVHVETGDSER